MISAEGMRRRSCALFYLVLHYGSVYCSLYGLFLLLAGMPHRDTTSASRGAYLLAGPKPPGRDSCSYGSRRPHLLAVLGTEATLNTCAVCFGGERPPGAVSLHNVNVLSEEWQVHSTCRAVCKKSRSHIKGD